jgi:hypothetical protein
MIGLIVLFVIGFIALVIWGVMTNEDVQGGASPPTTQASAEQTPLSEPTTEPTTEPHPPPTVQLSLVSDGERLIAKPNDITVPYGTVVEITNTTDQKCPLVAEPAMPEVTDGDPDLGGQESVTLRVAESNEDITLSCNLDGTGTFFIRSRDV